MKKLFLFAFGITALTSAQAQIQQVASASSIGIVPSNLAIDGKAYPVGINKKGDGTITLTVYDNAFNVKKSSVISLPTYEQKGITEESDLVKGTIIYDEESTNFGYYEQETDSVINTPDDFLRFCYYTGNKYRYNFESLEDFKDVYMCLTDYAGRFFLVKKENTEHYYTRDCPAVGKSLPYFEIYSYGYTPTTKKYTTNAKIYYWINYDLSQITTWTSLGYNGSTGSSYYSEIRGFTFTDADKGIEISCAGSQNLLNNDAKTEFLFSSAEEISREEYYKLNPDNGKDYNVTKVVSGTDIVLSRRSWDKYYTPVLSIIDEDGVKVCDIAKGDHRDLNMMRLNGLVYFSSYVTLSAGIYEYVVYYFSPETGVKEVARMKASNAPRYYNLSGQQVNADAKGIIIRDGKKFVNK